MSNGNIYINNYQNPVIQNPVIIPFNRNYWLMKIWFIILILISLVYFFSEMYFNPLNGIPSDTETLRSVTPSYPPPLVNFMDPPNVFSKV
jgi:hypothetical protein